MTDFSDRQKGEEAKYVRDEETEFRVAARRNRLLGHWAAEKMNLTEEETDAYAKAVVQADFEEAGDEDVIRKVAFDLDAAGKPITADALRSWLAELMIEAKTQVMSEIT